MTEFFDVWIYHDEHRIVVTDYPGLPVKLCGYVSAEAQQAAEARGSATISEIGVSSDCMLGPFESFEAARGAAELKAQELGGFSVICELFEDEDYGADDDFDDYGYDDEYDDEANYYDED